MQKKGIIFLLFCGIVLLAGCAEPESETALNSDLIGTVSDINALQQEQGRLVKYTLEVPKGLVNIEIQATVTVPETAVEEGKFEWALPTVEEIEEVFTDGKKMEPDTSEYQENSWRITSTEEGETVTEMGYFITSDTHEGVFQNNSLKSTVDCPYTDENCQDETFADKMQELTEQTESVYEKFGMQVKVKDREIGMDNNQYMANIWGISLLDDVPIIICNYGFADNACFIADDGVSYMSFRGSFTKKNAQEVPVISIDELLCELEKEAEAGAIQAGETITEITLAYCIDYNSQTFYPVWCLYGESNLMQIAVDAQTGEII